MYVPNIQTMSHWLRDVLEVEKGLLVVESTLTGLRSKRRELNTRRAIDKPQPPSENREGIVADIIICLFLAIQPTIIGSIGYWAIEIAYSLLLSLLFHVPFGSDSYKPLLKLFRRLADLVVGAGINSSSVSIAIVPATIYIVTTLFFIFAAISGGKVQDKEYEQELANYNQAMHAEEQRMARIKDEILPLLDSQISDFESTRRALIEVRTKLYKTGYLTKEYRDLIPVAAMLGYLNTGRCTTVYGHGGIIDTYVHDQQMIAINNKLDTIINMLDDIRMTQSELYHAINETKQEQNALLSEINATLKLTKSQNDELIECQRYNNRLINSIHAIAEYRALS